MTPPVKVERPGKGEVTCTVVIEATLSKNSEEKALARLGQRVSIKGFRPGHVPAEMLRERISPGELLEQTIREVVAVLMPSLLSEQKITPIIPPSIEVVSREPLTLKIVFVERPEMKLKGADKIKIEKKEKPVTDADVEAVIKTLLQRFRETDRSTEPAKDGDEIVLTAKTTDKNGQPVNELTMEHQRLLLGSARLVPGFAEGLLGMKIGEKKTYTITLPKDAPIERLRGQKVTVDAEVESVLTVTLPELTDTFVKERFGLASIAEMRAEVRRSLEKDIKDAERQRREQQLFDALRDAIRIELSPALISAEERLLLSDLLEQLTAQKRTLEEWLKESGKSDTEFQKELNTRASDRLKLRFALEEAMAERAIALSDDDLAKEIDDILKNVPDERREEIQEYYARGSDGWNQLLWQRRVEKLIASFLD